MNRWTYTLFMPIAALLVSAASAQTEALNPSIRQFPKDVQRGELVVLMAPEIALDGKPDRLSPAVRIRDANNHLVLSGTLANQRLVVNYLRDNIGLVHNVWVLTADEIKQKILGQPENSVTNIRSMFDVPKVKDDGNTPFNQLPKYKP